MADMRKNSRGGGGKGPRYVSRSGGRRSGGASEEAEDGGGGGGKQKLFFAGIARETLEIVDARFFRIGEKAVPLGPMIDAAVEGTVLYPDGTAIPGTRRARGDGGSEQQADGRGPTVRVQAATTLQAAEPLAREAEARGAPPIAALNFASARNPGGGFLRGSQAQEESLARSSALYSCLTCERARDYYLANHDSDSYYTDGVIFSPAVPFFRKDDGNLLEVPFVASVITAPAVNASVSIRKGTADWQEIERVMSRRIARILAVARHQGVRVLVAGAFGCGVFRNDPAMVAGIFHRLLFTDFARAFDLVVFAIPGDRRANIEPFRKAFGSK